MKQKTRGRQNTRRKIKKTTKKQEQAASDVYKRQIQARSIMYPAFAEPRSQIKKKRAAEQFLFSRKEKRGKLINFSIIEKIGTKGNENRIDRETL